MKSHPARCVLLLVLLLASSAPLALADECPDAWITAKLKTKLMGKIGMGAFHINIETEECVVTLQGCVRSTEDEAEAIEAAKQLKHVKAVKPELAFCPKKQSDDSGSDCPDNAVTSDLKLLLKTKDHLKDLPILVKNDNCRVQLFGCVDTREQEQEVVRMAKKMSPNKKARSHLELCEK